MATVTSLVDYTSKDYDGLKASMLNYATTVLPKWQSRSEGDFGVALVELMAYTGDILSYYGDRIQTEAYLSTATQRQSLLQIAGLLGYIPSNGVAAAGTVTLITSNPGPAVLVPAGTQVNTDFVAGADAPLTYETTVDTTVGGNGQQAVIPVVHGVTRTRIALGPSTGLPGQSFRLPEMSVISGSVRVFVDTTTPAGSTVPAREEWSSINFLVDATGSMKSFTTFVDSYGSTWVQFGDNLNGAVPNNGLNVYATYRIGGGLIGNIAANQIIGISNGSINGGVFLATDTLGVPQSSAMSGGADAESNDQIRANAPRVFQAQNRGVTLKDWSAIALAVPGVLRANTVAGSFSSVTVYVVGPDGRTPSPLLINSVQVALNAKSMAGVTATVASPSFVSVNVGTSVSPLTVQVYPNYKQITVRNDVDRAVKSLLSFATVDFARRLTVADFYSTIMSVPGVQWVTIPMIARSDAAQSGTADIVCRDWEIPTLGLYFLNSTGGIN